MASKQFGKFGLGARSWGSQSQSSLLRDDGCDVRFDGRVELIDEIDLDGGRRLRLVAGYSLRRRTMNRRLENRGMMQAGPAIICKPEDAR